MALRLNENWVAVNIIAADDFSGMLGIAYNAPGLTVSYRINGGAPIAKVLTTDDWREGTNGAYSMRFTSGECGSVGKLAYEVAYIDAAVYYGAEDIIEAPLLAADSRLDNLLTAILSTATAEQVIAVLAALAGLPVPPTVEQIQAGIATADQVTNAEAAIIAAMPDPTDVSGLATAEQLSTAEASIISAMPNPVDVSGLATTQQLSDAVISIINVIPEPPAVEEIQNGLATAENVDEIIAAVQGIDDDPGPQSQLIEYLIEDSNSNVVIAALVELYADSARTVKGPYEYTNTLGIASFTLNPGTYYPRIHHDGSAYDRDPFTVTAEN